MKSLLLTLLFAATSGLSGAAVSVDHEVFGNTLGGWTKRDGQAAEYPLSGSAFTLQTDATGVLSLAFG